MPLLIVGVLVLLWLLGLIAHIGGGFVWLLLVIALLIYIAEHLFGPRRT